MRRRRTTGSPLSLVLIDLDHFKKLNDSQGHQDGDEALRSVAALLAERTESRGGLAARFGGEEFAWLLPGVDARGVEGGSRNAATDDPRRRASATPPPPTASSPPASASPPAPAIDAAGPRRRRRRRPLPRQVGRAGSGGRGGDGVTISWRFAIGRRDAVW